MNFVVYFASAKSSVRYAIMIIFSIALWGCSNPIRRETVERVVLVTVDHPYIGHRVDSMQLKQELITDFLKSFDDKHEELVKFYSCYVIKIHLKNGELISYRTNGSAFEKFLDKKTGWLFCK